MNFSCDHCHRRYAIPDDKLRGKVVRVRCRNCQNPIILRGEGVDAQAVAPRSNSAPILPTTGEWYVMVKGQQVGPLPPDALKARIDNAEIGVRSFFWKKGMPEWKRGEDIDELRQQHFPGAVPLEKPVALKDSLGPGLSAGPSGNFAQGPARLSDAPAQLRGPGLGPMTAEPLWEGSAPHSLPSPSPTPAPGRLSTGTQDLLFGELDDLIQDLPAASNTGVSSPPVGDDGASVAGELSPGQDLEVDPNYAHFPDKAFSREKKRPLLALVKFAAFLLGVAAVALVVLVLLGILPLEVTRTNEKGDWVRESVFARGVVPGLKDVLSGKTLDSPLPPAAREPQPIAPPAPEAAKPDGEPSTPTTPAEAPTEPASDAPAEEVPPTAEAPSDEDVVKQVVASAQPAFQACVEQELTRNRRFKSTVVNLKVTVARSGVVKRAKIDRKNLDRTKLGECLKREVRRMRFPKSQGDLELAFPVSLAPEKP